MRKLRILTVLGTRPEIIRLSSLIRLLDSEADHHLLHTGQNFTPSLSDVFFADLELRSPDTYVQGGAKELSVAIGETLAATEAAINSFGPDAVVILGDTNSALAAIVAERKGVPVFHLEAGNRSFDSRVPEELNRRVVDHASSYNLCYSEYARRNLLSEGVHANNICVTGSPMGEVLGWVRSKVDQSNVLHKLSLEAGQFFLVSAHRQETVDNPENLRTLIESIESLRAESGMRVVVSTHPRTMGKIQDRLPNTTVEFLEPFGYVDYLKLQMSAACVFSDSGTISEESDILGFPAVTIRDSFERQEGLDAGLLATAGLRVEGWLFAMKAQPWRSQVGTVANYRTENFSNVVWNFMLAKLLPKVDLS